MQQTATAISREKLWNQEYLKVMTSNFLLFFAFYLLTPLLPLYLDEQFEVDKHIIGIVLSGYIVATLLIRPFSGYIVDAFNRKKVLSLCFLAFFICFSGYIGASTLLMFAIVRTMHGIPFGATTVANSTVAIDVVPSSRRNEGIGYYGLSNNIAMAVAPSAGIYLYNITHDFTLLFWISLGIAFLGFLTTTTVHIPERELIKEKPKISLDHFFLTKAWLLALNIMLFGLCWGVMSNYVAIYSFEKLHITQGTGVFFMLLSIGLICARLIGTKSLRKGAIIPNCMRGVLCSSVAYILFACSFGEWSFYLSAFILGIGNGQMYPAFLNMFVKTARHDQRGTANSSILISWDLGMGIGILLGGFVADFISYDAAFWTVALVQVAGALLFILASRFFFEKHRIDL